jgi:iron(III) transport system substrate-binding protein
LAACNRGGDELVIYSGRSEALVDPILQRFARDTGIDIRVQYADTSELKPTLLEEGDNTPADVFFSQDAGALAALANAGMLAELDESDIDVVDERFRDPDGRWVGVTGRARVIGYNTERVTEADLPRSVLDVTDPKWCGRVGFPPTNASFVGFVSALIESVGVDRTRQFLEGLEANEAKRYDNNILALQAVADGEIDLALVNHYYLYAEFKDDPDSPLANYYPGQEADGEGTFVNVAGVAILGKSDQSDAAARFVRYLLDTEAQEYFRDETSEYPLRDGVEPIAELPPLDELRTIDVPLTELGRDLEASTELLKEVGLT